MVALISFLLNMIASLFKSKSRLRVDHGGRFGHRPRGADIQDRDGGILLLAHFQPPSGLMWCGRRRLSHVPVAVLALAPTDLTVDGLKASALFDLLAPPLHMVGLRVVLP
jgi:hypothetical protein